MIVTYVFHPGTDVHFINIVRCTFESPAKILHKALLLQQALRRNDDILTCDIDVVFGVMCPL